MADKITIALAKSHSVIKTTESDIDYCIVDKHVFHIIHDLYDGDYHITHKVDAIFALQT